MSNPGHRRTAPAADEAMPPGGGGGGEHGCAVRGHPPAAGCDEDAPPFQPPPPFPAGEDLSLQVEKKQKQEEHEQQATAAASIPEGPLVEILSRVPYRSLCRFKCVSKPWLALCSDPEIRKKCSQTLSGFFYNKSSCGLSFCNLSGRGAPMVDPSLPFLGGRYQRVEIKQCCGGLLLCKYWKSYKGPNQKKYGYAVCNPVTEQWNVLPDIALPDPEDGVPVFHELFLAVDAADPSRFVVFAPLNDGSGEFAQAAIFSSETQEWTCVEHEWGDEFVLVGMPECVLLNGTMHLKTHGTIVTVDMEGEVWGEIGMPHGMPNVFSLPSIGKSQGCLYAWQIDHYNACKLYVWVLEDYASGEWTLKHTANVAELFGRQVDEDDRSYYYTMFAIHPDCNLVFLTDKEKMTVSYDLDTRKVDVICSFGEFLGGAPYVPCFKELLLKGIAASCTERRNTL